MNRIGANDAMGSDRNRWISIKMIIEPVNRLLNRLEFFKSQQIIVPATAVVFSTN